jgi:exopolysaccharide biosynthesis polyprenyl glycosylphosphotransferase
LRASGNGDGRSGAAGQAAVAGLWRDDRATAQPVAPVAASWTRTYLYIAAAADTVCALAAGLLAFQVRFGSASYGSWAYLRLSLALPVIWLATVALAGGYDSRFIGVGSDEFRRVLNAGVCLTACVAIVAYATKIGLARGYVVVALPSATALDLLARWYLRQRLHRRRRRGSCMRKVVVVGHAHVVADLAAMLCCETYHGLTVVAACLADPSRAYAVAGIPTIGGLGQVPHVVQRFGADTVAVLACPEMSGTRLRELAWELEKTGTDLCVAPALLDVAGPRTTIRPVVGLPLLHVDHPEFRGVRRLVKEGFDRIVAALALLLLGPALLAAGLVIRLRDGGPALFRQVRVGKAGRRFTVYKLRTMVVDADKLKAELLSRNEAAGVLFKMHNDPRVTAVGFWLRRWSVDELPQLINVIRGEMSLVGPRPLLPDEAERYGDGVQRRLAVKPGITGLWQVSGRSDLSWGDSVRLELRYVENWSLMLDLQVLWKTGWAVLHHSGAYLSQPPPTPDDQPGKDRNAQPARRAAAPCRLVRLGR